MELASDIRDEFLTCNICLEEYKQPKQLPCLHTFCQACLSRYITETVGKTGILSVPCPLCRRVCLPSDPDPRKLREWAQQFPDNFFVTSLRETLEARRRGGAGTGGGAAADVGENAGDSQTDQSTRYFVGETKSCSKHLTHRMSHYCVSHSVGVCELCLAEDKHKRCEDRHHLGDTEARDRATRLLKEYREQMEHVRQNVAGVKQAFGRKPRLLQRRKEEVEISVSDYFSDQRSRCAKLLLKKERETMDNLTKVVEDELQRAGDSQNKCDDILTSVSNTMSLFDTLTRSGPFNAMHVLATVEEQIANFGRLTTKMDQEAKADAMRFQPPSHLLEHLLNILDYGEIRADFGRGEVTVSIALTDDQIRGELDASVQSLENRLHELTLHDDTSVPSQLQGAAERNLSTEPPPPQNQDNAPQPSAASNTESTQENQLPECEQDDGTRSTNTDHQASAISTGEEPQPPQVPFQPYPSAPPLDQDAPPPYAAQGVTNSPVPSAPPLSSYTPSSADSYYASSSDRYEPSAAVTEAYKLSRRKTMSCRRVMVFSGNLPKESRRGGLCGAAMMGQVNRAAFVDRHNHSVKIIDLHQAQIVGYLHLGALEPWDITFKSPTSELVVTCPGPSMGCCLLFIPTSSRNLQVTFSLRTVVGYCCVAFIKEETFAGGVCAPFGRPSVHLFNTAGVVLRDILTGTFSYPRTIFSDSSGSQLIISDWTSNFVVLVTSEGVEICRYREAPSPKGVAISEETKMMHVLDGKWSRLHLLDESGCCVGTAQVEGCRDPRMVVVVPTRSSYFPETELSVIADGNNALHVMSVVDSDSQRSEDMDYYDYGYDYDYDYSDNPSSTV